MFPRSSGRPALDVRKVEPSNQHWTEHYSMFWAPGPPAQTAQRPAKTDNSSGIARHNTLPDYSETMKPTTVTSFAVRRTQHRLQLVQNAAARVVLGVSRYSHVTPLLRELHWLPVVFRVRFKVLVMTYKVLHGMGAPAAGINFPPPSALPQRGPPQGATGQRMSTGGPQGEGVLCGRAGFMEPSSG
ncbi:uncharacterized protein M6D78_003221 [Vipera latastei]